MSLLLQDTLVISPSTVEHIEGEIADVNERVDLIEASSDCADVVGTKAELDSYDKSKLTDKAVIKVLQDESQENAQTYYRYSKSSNSFTLIGELGPFYTKSEDDTLLSGKVDKTTTENQVYGTNSAGVQRTLEYSNVAVANSIAQRDANSQLNINLTPTANNHAASKKYVDDADALKQDKPTITASTGATLSVTLTDNTIFNNTNAGLTTLTITNPTTPTADFASQINFTSGSTATVVNASNIVWMGDNVSEIAGFVPRTNCRYTIDFVYDGSNIRGYIQGVSL